MTSCMLPLDTSCEVADREVSAVGGGIGGTVTVVSADVLEFDDCGYKVYKTAKSETLWWILLHIDGQKCSLNGMEIVALCYQVELIT